MIKILNKIQNCKIKKIEAILREILTLYLKKVKPGFRITGGRLYFLEFVNENFEQLLREAGLYEINLTNEGNNIRTYGMISQNLRNRQK